MQRQKHQNLATADLFLFDLDGTLIDSRLDILHAVNTALSSVGLAHKALDEVTRHIGRGTKRLLVESLKEADADLEAAFGVFTETYQNCLLENTRLYPGTLEVLNRLEGKTLAVVSNKRRRFCDPIIDGLGLRSRFAFVLGGDTVTPPKPAPDPLLHVLRETGTTPSKAVMIGDSPVDIEAGKKAGTITVGITEGFASPEDIQTGKPDFLIPTVSKLADFLF